MVEVICLLFKTWFYNDNGDEKDDFNFCSKILMGVDDRAGISILTFSQTEMSNDATNE